VRYSTAVGPALSAVWTRIPAPGFWLWFWQRPTPHWKPPFKLVLVFMVFLLLYFPVMGVQTRILFSLCWQVLSLQSPAGRRDSDSGLLTPDSQIPQGYQGRSPCLAGDSIPWDGELRGRAKESAKFRVTSSFAHNSVH